MESGDGSDVLSRKTDEANNLNGFKSLKIKSCQVMSRLQMNETSRKIQVRQKWVLFVH